MQFPVWAGCGEWAYATHPKSFRSSFGFNTNVWLTRKYERAAPGPVPPLPPNATPRGVARLAGAASLFAPGQVSVDGVDASAPHQGGSMGMYVWV